MEVDSQPLPIQALHLSSSRDLSPLYEAFAEEDDEEGNPVFLFSSFGYINAESFAYFGRSNARTRTLTATDIQQNLERLPDHDVYPEATLLSITAFSRPIDDKFFLKRPKLNAAFVGTGLLPKLVLQEAEIMELLLLNPHPNIIRYYGCVIRRGRIVGLVLDRYDMTLKQQLDKNMIRQLDVRKCMTQIESAIHHLHSLGLAHNDLTPMNIMVGSNSETLFLIDFGSCQPFGRPLITTGTPGWADEDFTHSAKEHDVSALRKLRSWLMRYEGGREATALHGRTPDPVKTP